MKYLKQFGIILAISFVSELMNMFIPLPVPASIYGIVILFLLLISKILPVESVREAGYFLVEIMPVMFIPAGAGLLESWGVLQPIWLPVCIITVATTVIVMAVTGRVTQAIIRAEKKKKEGKQA